MVFPFPPNQLVDHRGGKKGTIPLKENNSTDFPVSFYAATKKSNEVIAYSYSKLFKVPITVLRFFTVYGPYSRPDMAIYSFTRDILNNKVIRLYFIKVYD